ncbi:putative ABC transporter ATP-binding protein YfiL [Paenibacillus antibioticophila]|uniref:ABC transporter ATP-binding protein YfiL n=1 Tax=Paenibacillus antibioticophila TaxID=1274374 RepID=A0A920CI64_9BACL|nr:ABC transporter ATP-binding protein [Paenibacillus antibioticophila]GIO38443.1 putative ABC transporter ATP-binding protein YfiL [Paenibacillus antibioticophila]
MEKEIFLSVDGLSKSYGSTRVVDQVSFSVFRGEVFGLLGPNGAGKTTTISMLCGLLKADAGNVAYGGISISAHYRQVKGMIGLCPQDIVIWEKLTCSEQLKFAGMSYGLAPKEAGKRAGYLLEALGLTDKKNKLAGTLSGGMQRRLNIALALVHDPDLIILDEPQAGLDPQSRVLVRDFIRQLAAQQKSVLLTTHDMDEADRLSNRVAIIDHGKILQIDTPERLKEKSGKGDILQVRLSGIPAGQTDKLLEAFPPVFTEKKLVDGLLLLGASHVIEHIPTVNQTLKAFRIQMEDMTIRKRTLEDAFISMTGRGLRE